MFRVRSGSSSGPRHTNLSSPVVRTLELHDAPTFPFFIYSYATIPTNCSVWLLMLSSVSDVLR